MGDLSKDLFLKHNHGETECSRCNRWKVVWHKPNQQLKMNIKSTMKYDDESIIVWNCISITWIEELVSIRLTEEYVLFKITYT